MKPALRDGLSLKRYMEDAEPGELHSLLLHILKRLIKVEEHIGIRWGTKSFDIDETWKQKYEALKESHTNLLEMYNKISRNIPQ